MANKTYSMEEANARADEIMHGLMVAYAAEVKAAHEKFFAGRDAAAKDPVLVNNSFGWHPDALTANACVRLYDTVAYSPIDEGAESTAAIFNMMSRMTTGKQAGKRFMGMYKKVRKALGFHM